MYYQHVLHDGNAEAYWLEPGQPGALLHTHTHWTEQSTATLGCKRSQE